MECEVEPRRSPHHDLQMVRVDLDTVEQLVDQGSPFVFGGRGRLLSGQRFYSDIERSIFLGKQLGADLACRVQLQELPSVLGQRPQVFQRT
jgi:hypothetical protein